MFLNNILKKYTLTVVLSICLAVIFIFDVNKPREIEFSYDELTSSEWWQKASVSDVESLIRQNVDFYYTKDFPVIFYAVAFSENPKILKLIKQNDIDINKKDGDNNTILLAAISHEQSNDIIKKLVENGADVNIKNNNGVSPLYIASYNSNLELAKYLIEKKADVNCKDKYNSTPLILAIKSKHPNIEIIKLLIDNGADVNVRDNTGTTPLIYASVANNFEIVKLLTENGADTNIVDAEQESPLLWSINADSDTKIIKLLIEAGADVNYKNRRGAPLHKAIQYNNFEIVQLLVEHGADVNYNRGLDGQCPLFLVFNKTEFIKKPNLEIAKFLVEHGAKPDKLNMDSLSWARSQNFFHPEIYDFLNQYIK